MTNGPIFQSLLRHFQWLLADLGLNFIATSFLWFRTSLLNLDRNVQTAVLSLNCIVWQILKVIWNFGREGKQRGHLRVNNHQDGLLQGWTIYQLCTVRSRKCMEWNQDRLKLVHKTVKQWHTKNFSVWQASLWSCLWKGLCMGLIKIL